MHTENWGWEVKAEEHTGSQDLKQELCQPELPAAPGCKETQNDEGSPGHNAACSWSQAGPEPQHPRAFMPFYTAPIWSILRMLRSNGLERVSKGAWLRGALPSLLKHAGASCRGHSTEGNCPLLGPSTGCEQEAPGWMGPGREQLTRHPRIPLVSKRQSCKVVPGEVKGLWGPSGIFRVKTPSFSCSTPSRTSPCL